MHHRSQTLLLRYATSMVGSIGSIFFLRVERRSDRAHSTIWIHKLNLLYNIYKSHFNIF